MNVYLRWCDDMLRRFTRGLDWPLLLALTALAVIGLAVLDSAGGSGLVKTQASRLLVGLGAIWLVARQPIMRIRVWTPHIYVLSLLPLLAVFVLGTGKYGRQWLDLRFFYLQPAELLKVSMPMMVAWYLNQQPLPPRWPVVFIAGFIIGLPTALVMLQPDLGTAVLLGASGLFVLILAGLPWWWLGVGLISVLIIAPIAWFGWLMPYQKDRILMFLDPENDPLGAGWNIIQSRIAIGSGGMHGKGWGQGSQSQLNFIPEQSTDFAFSVLSEEFGWIGVVVVLLLYLFVIGRCLWIAACAKDGYARLVAGSVPLVLFVYVLVNGGMVSGLLPVVGIPMPLVSYGGTSAVSLLTGFGLVMAVRTHKTVHS